MPTEYIIYIPIVAVLSIILLSKAKNKAFVGLFILWLFGSPIFLNPRYVITLSVFGFDIQPNRFLFLILTPILVLWIMTPRRLMPQESVKPAGLKAFEIAMIGYILAVVLAVGLNINSMGSRTAIANITNSITFVVVYFCALKFLKKEDFNLLKIAVLTFAGMSAIVAVYQFFVNPDFFRLGVSRAAFSGYYRANGFFTSEYDQGLFLVLSIIVVASMKFKGWIKIPFIAIALTGIFLTMHRLSWLAAAIVLGLIWFLYFRKNVLTYIFIPLILILTGIIVLNLPWSQLSIGRFGSSLIRQRLLADTLTGRVSQYKIAPLMLKERPLGVGDYGTASYTQMALNLGMPLDTIGNNPYGNKIALVVHNGFLSAGVKYGIFGLVLFFLFIFISMFSFLKYSIQKGENWYPLLMIMITFGIYNLTNDFSYPGTQISVALAWLIGGYVAVNDPNYVGETNIQPKSYVGAINFQPALGVKAFFANINDIIINNSILSVPLKNPQLLQSATLFGSMFLSMGLTFISSIITARLLGPSNYGDLKYIQTVWSLLTLVITFGYFYSGSRVLVLENDTQKCREISGVLILMSLIMGIILCLVTGLIAYPLDYLFHANVAKTMALLAPLILIVPLSQSLPLILQSTNRIYLLSIFTGAPSVLYLISILILAKIKEISTSSVLISQQVTTLVIIVFVLIPIKPSLSSIKHWWGEIKSHHKTYGSPVYRGALFALGTTYLNRLAISYWVNNTAIGFFSLASSLVEPLKLLPNAIATSSFRKFATETSISKKILLSTIAITLASLVVAIIFFGTPLSWIYTTKFNEVGPMARALTIGAILYGFGDLFNRFMGAHGKGKSLQNASLANGIANVVGILILVPLLGAWGAVLTTIIAGAIYFLQLFLSYRTFSKKIASE